MNEQTSSVKALGMIEVRGRIGAIEALDAALKAANVSFVNISKVGGGLTAIFVEGEVGAVKAAVEAGGAAADRVSDVISVHVIPRPAGGIKDLTGELPPPVGNSLPAESEDIPEDDAKDGSEEDKAVKEKPIKEKPAKEKTAVKKESKKNSSADLPAFSEISGYNVSRLRALARSLDGFPMTRREINFAKREDITKELRKYLDGGNA